MTSFLGPAQSTPDAQSMYDGDLADRGYVMNLSRVWAHAPGLRAGISDLLGAAAAAGGLSVRECGILVTACASTLGDSYCSLAWGAKLAGEAHEELAAGVLTGDDGLLDDAERALARWARQVTRDPNGVVAADVQALRDAGFEDRRIFAVTTFVALRLAFSTVNDALGAQPDPELHAAAPPEVRRAVTYGRPVAS